MSALWNSLKALTRQSTGGTRYTYCTTSNPSVLWCRRIIFKDHSCQPGTIRLENGTISHCIPGQSEQDARKFADSVPHTIFRSLGGSTTLSPGLIDVHVHISELGRDWEGYHSATRAAAAGGITTLMSMPLNSIPPTVTVSAIQQELNAASKYNLMADVGLWGGVIPSTLESGELATVVKHPAIFGIKAFLAPLPPSAGYEAVTPEQLKEVATLCGRHDKPLLVHSELMTEEASRQEAELAFQKSGDNSCYESHLKSRPAQWERDAVHVVSSLVDRCDMHIVHLSDAGCLPQIAKTKASNSNYRLTVETCPHYLLFEAEGIPNRDTRYKCFPPIREAKNRQQLLKAVKEGLIDMIASDHSPCDHALRKREEGDLKTAWGGLTGLQYQLPATLAAMPGLDAVLLSKLESSRPASLIPGLSPQKGSIAVGNQADLGAWDSDVVYSSNEHHRWQNDCLYTEIPLKGHVVGTWLSGLQVYNGETNVFSETTPGRMLHSDPRRRI